LLQEAGITTFAGLAEMSPEQVRSIFEAAGSRVPDPTPWLEQAAQLKK
jgi:predicted flap endonuclease-1-like 5' DNA nuclease